MNLPIRNASKKGYIDIVKLLFNDKRVKDTLQKNNLELYNELIKQNIKNKVSEF